MKRLLVITTSALALALAAPLAASAQDTELDYDWWDGWEYEEDRTGWGDDDYGETGWGDDEWGFDDDEWGDDQFGETEWGDDYGYDAYDDYGYYDNDYDWDIGDDDADAFDEWYEEDWI